MAFAPSLVFADWTDFAPVPFENGAFLDVFGSYERDYLRAGAVPSRRWNDTFLRQKITLFSDGYSYDPRFLQYHFSIAGALREEDYYSTYTGSTGWTTGTGLEYDLRLIFLPEHPYNLYVFASRYEPLFKEQSAPQHGNVGTTYGTTFRYRQKPYFLHLGYVRNSIDSGETTSDVDKVSADGQYFKRFVNGNEISFTGGFNPAWFSNSEGLDGNAMQYSFGNMVNLQRVRLTSNVSQNFFEQQSDTAGTFKTDQLTWYELLDAKLPWNFRSDLSYRYVANDNTVDQPGGEKRDLSDKGGDLQVDVAHRLYQSLDTTYTFLRNHRTFTGGETSGLTNSIATNYSKSIPRGRLMAGVSFGRSDTDTNGQAGSSNESFFGIPVPGSFALRQRNVDVPSIIVFVVVREPLTEYVQLGPENYTVNTATDPVQIIVRSLPGDLVYPGTYDFFVSYLLTTGDFSLRTDTIAGNTSAQLFENLLTPYFSYVQVNSTVLSGTFPGIPNDSTTYTAGLLTQYGPVRLRGEYQKFEWEVSPYESWRAELQYVSALSPTLDAYATASYLNTHYPRGTSADPSASGPETAAFTEDSESVSANLVKRLYPPWNMSFGLGGSYTRLNGLVDSNAYAGNATWTWTIGEIDISAGASAYASDSSGAGTFPTRRDHELFYLNFRRRLF